MSANDGYFHTGKFGDPNNLGRELGFSHLQNKRHSSGQH